MISALTFSDPNFSFDELEPTKHSLKFCKDYIARYFVPLSCGNIALTKVLDDKGRQVQMMVKDFKIER